MTEFSSWVSYHFDDPETVCQYVKRNIFWIAVDEGVLGPWWGQRRAKKHWETLPYSNKASVSYNRTQHNLDFVIANQIQIITVSSLVWDRPSVPSRHSVIRPTKNLNNTHNSSSPLTGSNGRVTSLCCKIMNDGRMHLSTITQVQLAPITIKPGVQLCKQMPVSHCALAGWAIDKGWLDEGGNVDCVNPEQALVCGTQHRSSLACGE